MDVLIPKFKKLDWLRDGFSKPWVSRKYRNSDTGEIAHDLRCDICGKWYTYSHKDIERIKAEDRWNSNKNRPFHCGNSMCQDYHQREMLHKWKMVQRMLRGEPVDSQVL